MADIRIHYYTIGPAATEQWLARRRTAVMNAVQAWPREAPAREDGSGGASMVWGVSRGTAAATGPGQHRQPDVVCRYAPLVALAVAVVAAVTDPAGWVGLVMLAAAVALFVLWQRWPALPAPVLAAGVLVLVAVAQLSGLLSLAMFLVAVAAVIVARSEGPPWRIGAVCLALVASPAVIVALQPSGNRIAWGIWVIGIAFSAVIGRGMYRQERLSDELEAARLQLAVQAQAEERRRIARDVHDLVGHGLAAVLMQVTSARHVLRRDTDAAEEALAAAEAARPGAACVSCAAP